MGEKKVVKVKAQPNKEQLKEEAIRDVPLEEPTVPEPVKTATEKQFYKQWWFWLILAGFVLGLIALLTRGGGSGSENTANSETNVATVAAVATVTSTQAENAFNEEQVLQQLQITPYIYKPKYGDSQIYLLQIKNNSEYTLDISGSITFMDASNNMIGTSQDTMYDVPSGKEYVMIFRNETVFDHVDQKLTVKETKNYDPVANELVIDSQNLVGDKVVFTVRNAGNTDIDFPKVTALFFKDDQVVFAQDTYVEPEGASALGAGQSINKELSAYGIEFDKVMLFTTGRSEIHF